MRMKSKPEQNVLKNSETPRQGSGSLCGTTCFLEKNLHRRGRLDNIEKYYRK